MMKDLFPRTKLERIPALIYNIVLRTIIADYDHTGLQFPIQKFILGERALQVELFLFFTFSLSVLQKLITAQIYF
jgi:hypothetical protein